MQVLPGPPQLRGRAQGPSVPQVGKKSSSNTAQTVYGAEIPGRDKRIGVSKPLFPRKAFLCPNRSCCLSDSLPLSVSLCLIPSPSLNLSLSYFPLLLPSSLGPGRVSAICIRQGHPKGLMGQGNQLGWVGSAGGLLWDRGAQAPQREVEAPWAASCSPSRSWAACLVPGQGLGDS